MNIDGRRIRIGIVVRALTTLLIQPTLASRPPAGGRSMPSRAPSGSYRSPQGGVGSGWPNGRTYFEEKFGL
jgi:hypothetical protein